MSAPFDPFQCVRVEKVDQAMQLFNRWKRADNARWEASNRRFEVEKAYYAKAGFRWLHLGGAAEAAWWADYNEACADVLAEEDSLEVISEGLLKELLALPPTPGGIQAKLSLALEFAGSEEIDNVEWDFIRAAIADATRLAGGST